jgi:hypothetical protein
LATDRLSTFSMALNSSSGLSRRVADVRLRYP